MDAQERKRLAELVGVSLGNAKWWRSRDQWRRLKYRVRHTYIVFDKFRRFGDIYEMGMRFVRKRVSDGESGHSHDHSPGPLEGFGKLPALWEFLGFTQWDDGTARETGTILIWYDDGQLHAMLRDRANGLVAFHSDTSLRGLLDGLDRGIQAESLQWRSERRKGGSRKK